MPSRQQVQGGKVFGLLKAQQEERLNCINKEFLEDEKYNDVEELGEKLESFKKKYVEFDLNDQGDIDLMSLKQMLEKLGVPKTHLEVKKMITEVTGGGRETISYRDFVTMMLGKRSGVLKLSRSCIAPSALGCDSERLTMAEPEAEPRGQGGGDRERGRSRRKVSRRDLKIGKERNYIV